MKHTSGCQHGISSLEETVWDYLAKQTANLAVLYVVTASVQKC